MNDLDQSASPSPVQPKKKRSLSFYIALGLGILFLALIIAGVWWWRHTLYAKRFDPTQLSQKEEVVLDNKLDALGDSGAVARPEASPVIERVEVQGRTPAELEVEMARIDAEAAKKKAELAERARNGGDLDPLGDDVGTDEERRHLVITEREINAILHKNTDLADRVRIEFLEDTIRAGALIPFDEDAPLVGGKTLRCKCSVKALLDENKRLAIYITDVTLGGVPIPNAWIGGIKNVNLVDRPSTPAGDEMSRFADGIKDFKISNGQIEIWLNE